MHILVPIKRVIDYNVKVRVKRDETGVETANVKMSMNPFDEVAVEQAVRLKEKGIATKVTVVTCGAAVAQDVLRVALAMGADAAILVDSADALDSLSVAGALKKIVEDEAVGLVLCGKQAIDDDLGAAGPMLAALLDWPQAVSVNSIEVDGAALKVVCDGDQGMDQLELSLPAVLTVDLRLCDPRIVTLPGMMRAKKTAIATRAFADLQVAAGVSSELLKVSEPPARQAGVMVASVEELVAKLKPLLAQQ